MRRPDAAALACLGALLLANLPLFAGAAMPLGDTSHVFRSFSFFLGELLAHAKYPLWSPYDAYGLPTDTYYLVTFSPAALLALAAGAALGIRDALVLFKGAYFLEQLTLVMGTYLLGRQLYARRATAALAAIGVLCGLSAGEQIFFNLRSYALFPLVLLFIVRFFREMRPTQLILAMLVFLLQFQGIAPYMIAVPLLAFALIGGVMGLSARSRLGVLARIGGREAVFAAFLLLIFACALAAYYVLISRAASMAVYVYEDRDPGTFAVTLADFLSYGPKIGFLKFLGLVLPFELGSLKPAEMGDTLYTGLAMAGLAAYALVRVPHPLVRGIGAAMLALALLSLGGLTPVAEFLYRHFPLMDYYRHIGSSVNCYKVFVPVLAGFGIERLTGEVQRGGRPLPRAAFAIAALAASTVGLAWLMKRLTPGVPWGAYAAFAPLVAAIPYALFVRARALQPAARLLLVLGACIAIETLLYQGVARLVHDPLMGQFYRQSEEAGRAEPLRYVERRSLGEPYIGTPRWDFFGGRRYAIYSFDYNYVQTDPCFARFRVDMMNPFVLDLLGARYTPEYERDWDYHDALGCRAPKLRLLTVPRMAAGHAEALALARSGHPVGASPIVEGDGSLGAASDTAVGGEVSVTEFRAGAIALDVLVRGNPGAWLYYADAWHPDWRAWIDGREAAVHRANVGFKAVYVPEGRHGVRMEFRNHKVLALIYATGALAIAFQLAVLLAVTGGIRGTPRAFSDKT